MDDNAEKCFREDFTIWKEFFDENGYLIVEDLLSPEEVKHYQVVYNDLLSNKTDVLTHRHDLGSHIQRKNAKQENICQIMWPSKFVENLVNGKIHTRALKIVKNILGDDMILDFDMLISKAPYTNTPTPAHQDESYWLDMPDKRSVTVWVALDDATLDNGCMWFVPGSYKKPLRPHRPAAKGHHVLCCEAQEDEMTPAPIRAGSCTLHHGRTIHYTRGNTTDCQRRAFIVNFRPESMVKWERDHGFDHGKKEGLKDILEDDEVRRHQS